MLGFKRGQENNRDEKCKDQDYVECRKNSLHAALIKRKERKRSAPYVRIDMTADKKSGDNEEDIDAGETSGEERQASVKQHDAQDRDRANTVNICAIGLIILAENSVFSIIEASING